MIRVMLADDHAVLRDGLQRLLETYRQRLMRKLGIDNFASLVRYAIRHGLVSLD